MAKTSAARAKKVMARRTPSSTEAKERPNEALIWPELALVALLNIAWLVRLGFVGFFGYRLLKGTLLVGAALGWKIAFISFYLILSTAALIYFSSFWRERGAMNTRVGRFKAMKMRLALHTATIGLIALEMAWDLGHSTWVVSILTSLFAAGLWLAVGYFLLNLASRLADRVDAV